MDKHPVVNRLQARFGTSNQSGATRDSAVFRLEPPPPTSHGVLVLFPATAAKNLVAIEAIAIYCLSFGLQNGKSGLKMKMIILAGLLVSASFADTVDFSSSTSTPNSTGLPSIVASNSSWATALSSPIASTWITATGDVDPPNGTTVTFTVSFMTPASLSSAFLSLGVLADDTATVKIDNTTLFAEDTTLGSVCAAGVIGCTSGNEGILNNVNVTADLAPGSSHTITVQAFQLGGGTFGVDFDGSITTNTATTPEPASALPLGAGLLVGIGLLRRRAGKRG